MSTPSALVSKLWSYCNILRDDGLSYGDYVEQLAFLLFLNMADEQSRPPFNKPSAVPEMLVEFRGLNRIRKWGKPYYAIRLGRILKLKRWTKKMAPETLP
jgi:hypothetical protein